MRAESVRARFLFKEVAEKGHDLPLGSVTKDGGVEFRSDLNVSVWNPGDDVSGYKRVRKDDFVIGLRSFQSGIGHSAIEALVSPAYTVLRPISKQVHPPFFRYLFKSSAYISRLENVAQGIRQGRTISSEDFYNIEVQVPSLAEQKAIADYLDRETTRIDALIEKYQKLESLLELRDLSMVHSKIFGEERAVESIHRPSLRMQLRRVVIQTNAGEVIDKSWWGSGNERLYTCAREALNSNYENFPDWKRTKSSDLLITRNGTPYIHIPLVNSIYSNVVQRINIGNKYSREYVAFALEAVVGGMKAQGVSIDSFNYDMWKSLVIPLPELASQELISNEIVSSKIKLGRVRESVQRQMSLLIEYRQTLITAAVTGELEIPEVAA